MAEMITPAALRAFKKGHPGAATVCYVNSSAAVKAESDICCTSSNAVRVVESLEQDEVIFVPDYNLAMYAQRFTRKKIHPWSGFCPTHHQITAGDVLVSRMDHPGAAVVVHPECRQEVIDLADGVFSTDGMLKYAKKTGKDLIVGTEVGIIHRLKKENPGKNYYPVSDYVVCPNMKMNTLATVRDCLRDLRTPVTVPEDIRIKAKNALDRMLAVGRGEQ